MAPVKKWVPASVDDVWAMLADPRSYAFWVVGSHDIGKADDDWPAVGATFQHTQGHGPLKWTDTSTVMAVEAPHKLDLEVRVRPFLVANVEMRLAADGEGTCITIDEYVTGGITRAIPRLLTSPLIGVRNADGLRRLAGMAWARGAALGHAPADQAPEE